MHHYIGTGRNTLRLATNHLPTPLKQDLPRSQFFSLRRICHTTEDFIDKSVHMKTIFLEWAYPCDCAEEAKNMTLQKSRN